MKGTTKESGANSEKDGELYTQDMNDLKSRKIQREPEQDKEL
jgi:hypothetical protein